MHHKEIEAFHPSCLSQTKESIRHLLSILLATIITVAAAVYHGEDSIIFALCIFNNRVFRLFRVDFDTRYPNISSYIPFLAVIGPVYTEIKISIPSNVYRSTVLADWVQLYSSGLNDAHRISLITAHFVLSTKPTLVPPLLHY